MNCSLGFFHSSLTITGSIPRRIGVQGGGAAAPRLENFQGKLCVSGQCKFLKNSE